MNTIDCSQNTADDMIAAMEIVKRSAVAAGLLRPGDRVVYRMDDAYNVATVVSVERSGTWRDGVEVTTDLHTWSCSGKNMLCHLVTDDQS
jgi:hypothetical protein